MKRKLALLLGTVSIVALGVMAFSAFESYVLNITAHVEPALNVFPHGDLDLGNVFPEEQFTQEISVAISKSFQAEDNVDSVEYIVGCNLKGAGFVDICPNISVQIDGSPCLFYGVVGSTNAVTFGNTTNGIACHEYLDKETKENTISLVWLVPDCADAHQKEPQAKEINCGKLGVDVGANVFIQVLGIERNTVKEVDPKEPKQQVFKFTVSTTGPARFVELGFGKPGQELEVSHTHALAKGSACGDDPVIGFFSGHDKPSSGQNLEFYTYDFGSDCLVNGDEILIEAAPAAGNPEGIGDQLTPKGITYENDAGEDVTD